MKEGNKKASYGIYAIANNGSYRWKGWFINLDTIYCVYLSWEVFPLLKEKQVKILSLIKKRDGILVRVKGHQVYKILELEPSCVPLKEV